MMNPRIVGATVGAVALSAFLGVSAHATGTANRMTYLTFSGAVALPGVDLAAGTYVFELASPNMDPTMVRVTSRDHRKVYLLAFTHDVLRPEGQNRNNVVSLAEAPRGQAPRITAWFPPDESMGREFVYTR